MTPYYGIYCQTSNISHTLVGNKIVDHSDAVGALPIGTAPTTFSFLTKHLASMDWAKTTARRNKKHLSVGIWSTLYQRFDGTPQRNLRVMGTHDVTTTKYDKIHANILQEKLIKECKESRTMWWGRIKAHCMWRYPPPSLKHWSPLGSRILEGIPMNLNNVSLQLMT